MRLFILSIIGAVLLAPVQGVAKPEYERAAVGKWPALTLKTDKKKKKKKAARRYINIAALHESLEGSHLQDDGCLLLRVDDCDVMFFADDAQRVKFILVRVAPHVKKNKRRAALNAVKSRLRLVYNKPAQADEIVSADGNAALLYYDAIEGAKSRDLLSETRWDALRNTFCAFEDSKPALQDAAGLACAFSVEKDGVELEIALDLASPTVNYVEVRGGKVQNKMKTNPEEVVESVFPRMDTKPERAYSMFGKGACRLRTLTCDGTFYLARNARFFAAGTVDALKKAVEREANVKRYGFEAPDFSSWQVTLPASPVTESLLNAPKEESAEEEEAENEKTPDPAQETPATPAADTPGDPRPTPPQPAAPQVTPPPAAPLTPEAARDAYRKMLREM